jgi:hypothetical protein
MRVVTFAFILLLGLVSFVTTPVRAESSDACKKCGEQQTACRKNYSAKTCKTEFDICMKGCKQK